MTHWEFGLWGSGGLLLIPTSMIYRKQMICDAHKENKSTYRMLLLRTFLVGKEIHKLKKGTISLDWKSLEGAGGGVVLRVQPGPSRVDCPSLAAQSERNHIK